jgi:hypothetical protein
MDVNFYDGPKGKVIGLTTASPEELQTYSPPFVEIPDGCQLTARVRTTKQGRREILIGAAEVGKALVFEGESDRPLPPTAPTRALEIPQSVKDAKDDDLEVMAAANGVKVNAAWQKRPRPVREADVAAAMAKRKAEKAQAVGV